MRGLTIGALVERNARKRPEKEAVVLRRRGERDEAVTFAELHRRVRRIAGGLRARDVEKGDKVAVYTENSIETLEAYLGTMEIGGLPVPINHRFKAKEVRYVLQDSDAKLCVFDADAADVVERIYDDVPLRADDFLFAGEDGPEFASPYESLRTDPHSADLGSDPSRIDEAILLYTSGTTGKPKGCVLTHDNLIQNAENTVYEADFRSGERFLLVTPLFHVAALVLFLDEFYVGATTIIADEFDPERTMRAIEEERVTGSFLVPTMSRTLLGLDGFDSYDLSRFQRYVTGGAPSGADLKKRIVESFDCDLYEVFGQTELSPLTTLLKPDEVLERPDSVGRPIINVEVKVVDEAGEEVEPGEIGRIAYRGPTVFEGYHDMPEKTADSLDGGWFVSGDLVRRDADGFVYFVGRADDMIVSGGENVHPAEIEEVLHEHSAIESAAVVGVPDEKWGERVKAAVVTEDGTELPESDVIEHVRERLADYKAVREIEFLDELPRNPSGKVIKDKLT